MKVLAKDLCKPEVVAAIAKIGFVEIEDRQDVTTEMWEKFRDATHNIHYTQPLDPEDLEAKLRNCSPRLSEPPTPPRDYSPSLSQTPVEDPEEELERYKFEARQAYDTLIQTGGRPTRPIRPTPPWTKVFVGGELWYRYAEQYEELFYDSWYGYKPGPNNSLTEADFIGGHWFQERGRCNEELRRWQDFHDTRQSEVAKEENIEWQRYPQDPQLTVTLKKLKDWKEYQGYFRRLIDRYKQIIEGARRAVEAIQRKDPEVVVNNGKVHGRSHEDWLRTIQEQREKLAAEEKRLEWAKKQLPAVLSECAMSLTELPKSRRQMEERSEMQAKQVYTTLVDTGGRPTRPIRPVSDIYKAEYTDKYVYALCHWEGECSHFEEELREWKKFLAHRQEKKTDRKREVQLEERQCIESPTQVDIWNDHRAYQYLEVENTKQWVEFWQRQIKYFQQEEDVYARQGTDSVAYRMHSEAENMQSHIEEARKQVGPAEARLEWVEQQLSVLLAGCVISTTQISTFDRLEDQAELLKRGSRSGQTTLKDLRSNQSNQSAPRSNHNNQKNRPSVHSVLGPIQSSKVSKAAGRKKLRPQRQSKIFADRDDSQNQGLNTTISPPPRRSRRLSTNQKRTGALEADLATELERTAQPQLTEVMLRRSDRISKQKERRSISTSSAALSSVVILQTAPLPRSKPKGRVAGTKPDRSWGKPRGISKTRGNRLSYRAG